MNPQSPNAAPNPAAAPTLGPGDGFIEALGRQIGNRALQFAGRVVLRNIDRVPVRAQDWLLDQYDQLTPEQRIEVGNLGYGAIRTLVDYMDVERGMRNNVAGNGGAQQQPASPTPKHRQAPAPAQAAPTPPHTPTPPRSPARQLVPTPPSGTAVGGSHNTSSTPPPPTRSWHPSRRPSQQPTTPVAQGNPNGLPTRPNTQLAPATPNGPNTPNPNKPGGNNPNRAPRKFDLDLYEDDLRDLYQRYEADWQRLTGAYDGTVPHIYTMYQTGAPRDRVEASFRPIVTKHAALVDQLTRQYRQESDALMQNAYNEAWNRLTPAERELFTLRDPSDPDNPAKNGIIALLDRQGATASGSIKVKLQRISSKPGNDHRRYAEIVMHDLLHTVVDRTHWDDPQSRQRTNATISSFRTLLENQKGELSAQEKQRINQAHKRADPNAPDTRESTKTRTLAFNNVVRIAVDVAERDAVEQVQRGRLVQQNGSVDYVTLSPPRAVGKALVRGQAVAIQDYLGLRAHTQDMSHYAHRSASGDVAARVIGDIDHIIWEQGTEVVKHIMNKAISPQVGNILLNDILGSASSDQAAEMIYYCLTGRRRNNQGNQAPQPGSGNQTNGNTLPSGMPLGLPGPGQKTP